MNSSPSPFTRVSARAVRLLGVALFCFFNDFGEASAAGADQPHIYSIPPGDAAATLKEFVKQSGKQVVYLVDQVSGVSTNAVKGELTARDAFDQLLSGTSLEADQDPQTGTFNVRHRAAAVQTAGPSPNVPSVTAAGAAAKKDEEVVVLSEFNVSAGAEKGYGATQSLTGTRIATAIYDLPFSVNVLTREFFSDFAMFELSENVAYISSFGNINPGGGYFLRGFSQAYQLRDGFTRLGRTGQSSVESIEVIKGPNAGIYGAAQPGGTLNVISKKPKETASQTLSVSEGSYSTTRATAEATGPTGLKNTYYIFDYGYYERYFDLPFTALRSKEFYLAVQHNFSKETSLLLSAEYVLRINESPQGEVPELYNPTTKTYLGVARNLAYFNQNGPNSEASRSIMSYTGMFTTRFGNVWSMRTGVNISHDHYWLFNNGAQTQYNIVTNSITHPTPTEQRIEDSLVNVQNDLLAHWWLWGQKIENRDLFTVDIADYYRFTQAESLKSGVVVGTPTFIIGQPINYYVPPYDTINYVNGYGIPGNTTGTWAKNRIPVYGELFRHQSAFFDGRLLVFGNLRYDDVHLRLRNWIGVPANAPATAKTNIEHWTSSEGVNYKVLPGIALYASNSSSFNPLLTSQDAKTVLAPEIDRGWDYGLKAQLLKERLSFTLGGFYATRQNVVVPIIGPNGLSTNQSEGSQLVRGIEFDGSWRITNTLTVGGAWGHTNSQITSDGYRYMSLGRQPSLQPFDNGAFYVRKAWDHGPLKDFSANLGITYTGPSHPDTFNAGDTYTLNSATHQEVFTSSTYQWAIRNPGYTLFQGGIRYRLPIHDRWGFTHQLGFNINNITNKFYIASVRYAGDRRNFYFNYTLGH